MAFTIDIDSFIASDRKPDTMPPHPANGCWPIEIGASRGPRPHVACAYWNGMIVAAKYWSAIDEHLTPEIRALYLPID